MFLFRALLDGTLKSKLKTPHPDESTPLRMQNVLPNYDTNYHVHSKCSQCQLFKFRYSLERPWEMHTKISTNMSSINCW